MIPRSRSLKVEDFPDQSDWIEPIIRAINDGSQQTATALSGALTFGENFNASLQTLEVTTASSWQTPSLVNGWSAFGGGFTAPAYRRIGDRVEIRGIVTGGTLGLDAFVMPVGYRPAASVNVACVANGAFGAFTVGNGGTVRPAVGSTTQFSLECSFAVDSPPPANGAFPVTFSHKLNGGAKAAGCIVIGVRDLTTGGRSPASASGYCAWRPNGAEVIIDDVPGLYEGRKYQITFLVFGG